jgi:hypothetical protein
MYSVCDGWLSPAQVFPFGDLRIKVCVATPRSFSQLPTSFIASWYQGIHRILLVACPHLFKGTCYLHEISKLISLKSALRCIYLNDRYTSNFILTFFCQFKKAHHNLKPTIKPRQTVLNAVCLYSHLHIPLTFAFASQSDTSSNLNGLHFISFIRMSKNLE